MTSRQRIRDFILTNFYATEPVSDDLSLVEAGIIDSTGTVELIRFLERDFHIQIPHEDLLPENLDTISRMAAYVARVA
jgi:acyl carrier protein